MATNTTFSSNSVNVFPSSQRTAVSSGKLTSESNFVNIINCLTDDFKIDTGTNVTYNDGYLLSYTDGSEDVTVKVIIHGYYFEVKNEIDTGSLPLWLGIKIRVGDGRLVNYVNTNNNLDVDNYFTGLRLYEGDEKPVGGQDNTFMSYWLQIYDGKDWINEVKFNANKINYSYDSSDGSSTTVKDKLDDIDNKKQNNLTVETSDSFLTWDANTSTLGSNSTHLEKIKEVEANNAGGSSSNIKVMYVKDGIAKNYDTGADVGKNITQVGESNSNYSQGVIIKDGVITAGQKIYISSQTPGTTSAKIGDLWFRYSTSN